MSDTDTEIELKQDNPVEKIISRIKEMINAGTLKPGDRLPAERKLAADMSVGRTHIREALHKLEFYGIVKTLPQSGSVINGLDITTLDGLLSDVLNLQNYDFFSLVETRVILETTAIRLSAHRRTARDIENLEKAHADFVTHYNTNERVSKDFAFHRAIAESSHNPVIKALLNIIIPDILTIYLRDRICVPNSMVIEEHAQMIDFIRNGDAEAAVELMQKHLQGVFDFAKQKINTTATL